MMAELPTTPNLGNTVNMMVKAVPYKNVNAPKPHQPAVAVGKCKPLWLAATAAANTATVAMVVKVRKRPSTSAASCWVMTKAKPNVADAAMAKPTPTPICPHCWAAPSPDAAPITSRAKASPNSITGMANNTARSGRWPYSTRAQKAVSKG